MFGGKATLNKCKSVLPHTETNESAAQSESREFALQLQGQTKNLIVPERDPNTEKGLYILGDREGSAE